tara:strand:+ start:136 stop:666 length:531 start_codon:yes stop_codon:yes gene_type:complete
MTEKEHFTALCNLTTKVLGLEKGALSKKSRKRPLQVARAITAYIGRLEKDIHRKTIADVLDRDRTLIYHYENRHQHYYATCLVYRNTFNKIYTAYEDLDKSKKVFKDGDFLKSYLLQNGVVESLKVQQLLEVKSGDAVCIIKLSYFDFSPQFSNVKKAMSKENYDYSLNVLNLKSV